MVVDHGHQLPHLVVMTIRVSKSQFKAKALEYLCQVETTGEAIVITDRGRPALELRPLKRDDVDPFEALRGSVYWYDRPFDPAVEPENWGALT